MMENKILYINKLWLSLFVSAVLPMLLGFFLAQIFPDWRWSNYPFHSMIESVGSVSALVIATLIIIMVKSGHLVSKYIVVASALLAMGLLDGFHAVCHAGVSFVWLHSIATMIGGCLFAAIWLSDDFWSEKKYHMLIFLSVIFSVLIGIVSVLIPEVLPVMIIDGHFSLFAKLINFMGGIGFLIGTAYFIILYRQDINNNVVESIHNENVIFANHCLLFGIAALLFELSVLWDAGWWWWHILRLLAYIIVLIYFFILFERINVELRVNEKQLDHLNKKLEQKVLERTDKLEKASNAKSEFLSSMSHELRTPMNAILGFGQLLEMQKNELNESQNQPVKEIMSAGRHLLDLINDVLDLAKIEEGKLELLITDVSIDKLIPQCISLVKPSIDAQQITLIDHLSELQYSVLADFTRLKQVIINLLSNAIKYNSFQGKITLQGKNINNQYFRISITDTGNGLSNDELSKLFIPFKRLNKSENIEGTGIGLVISKKMIKLMDGNIGVESTVGKGSTFWVELKLFEDDV